MTRHVPNLPGHTDVCSICGDDPAAGYRLEPDHRPLGGVDTFRLCDDYLAIGRGGGEPFSPLEERA